MELQRAKALQYDLIKSYVRLPDLQQKRMVEFAHSIGVPVATHEIYPAALVGVDNTEHTAATSRRGYSPKMATLQRAYEDVIQLFGKSGRIFCPMISGGGARRLFELEPALKDDARFKLYPAWMQRQVAQQPAAANPGGGGDPTGGSGRMVLDVMNAGGLVVAGTDTPNAINLHGELMSYVMAGMTPYDALKTATVNPARALGLDAGTIEARQAGRPDCRRRRSPGRYRRAAPRPVGGGEWPSLRCRHAGGPSWNSQAVDGAVTKSLQMDNARV